MTEGADAAVLAEGRRVLSVEAQAVAALAERLDDSFVRAVEMILRASGRVIVSGVGKSAIVGRKIAATLTSTGTPAMFLHPVESVHGDLGIVGPQDVAILISKSGTSDELLSLLEHLKRFGVKSIALTGEVCSPLGTDSDVALDAWVREEACPHDLAPTTSTTAALALGDALAVALLDARGFTKDDFARSHPRGRLPRQALLHVGDVMRKGEGLPLVAETAPLRDALREMTRGRIGMTAVRNAAGKVSGIFTDGDLRRALEKGADFASARVADVMTAGPRTIRAGALAAEAVQIMEAHKVNQLLVVDERGELAGALNMHDLFRAKVI